MDCQEPSTSYCEYPVPPSEDEPEPEACRRVPRGSPARRSTVAVTIESIALLLALLVQIAHANDVIYLRDGSPLFGEELTAPNGKLVTQFFGIPFAEPPVGNLRFRKPVPKAPWRNILNATVLPNSCIQSLDTNFGEFFGATMWNANTKQSEDCLYLNVFVPGRLDQTKRLAVMVWVFGGGFWSGSSTLDVYDGKIFPTEENIILVTLNYRVSIFGFLYLGTPEAPGNMGLWDQHLALKWVHANIDQFGGDNTRITLFGESAGAASVNMQMLSEKSTPYFHRAIIQSGSATAPWAMETTERTVVVYNVMKCEGEHTNMAFHEMDINKIYKCFMSASHETLRDNEWAPVREFVDFPWVPVVDGDFLIESAQTSLRNGHFKTTQLLAGSNLDESIYFIVYQLGEIFPLKKFFTGRDFIQDRQTWIKGLMDLLPREMVRSKVAVSSIVHEYEPADLPVKPSDWINALDKALGDLQFTCNVNEMALAHTRHGGDTFYYYFSHRASMQTWPAWMGVLHGYEINFIFGEPYNRISYNYTREEQELSSRFMRYWANFARTGDPNKNEDGSYTTDPWPKYNAASMQYMNLTVESDYTAGAGRLGHGPRRKECQFWKAYLPNLMTALDEVELIESDEESSSSTTVPSTTVPVEPTVSSSTLPYPMAADTRSSEASLVTPIVVALSLYGLVLLTAVCLVTAPRFFNRRKTENLPECTCEEEESLGPTIYMTDIPDPIVHWKQEMHRWSQEYMLDWQRHFEQYKKYQNYRRRDSDEGTCDL
ncbi:ace-1 [Pristionchus pacificus]|uniref:acetylcholinesterase n=1 Tax=Pristionchus pacificus TaxID=54126 RepID=A0A2A6C715_PRIPA|nr:ace-1 [Pristionchus pacificus]|eukprot:PDM73974.1 ace-1 [Pristionchus pacificus]